MKDQYTSQDITKFYQQFKELPEYLPINKIAKFLSSPEAELQKSKLNRLQLGRTLKIIAIIVTSIATIALLHTILGKTGPHPNSSPVNESLNNLPRTETSAILDDTTTTAAISLNPIAPDEEITTTYSTGTIASNTNSNENPNPSPLKIVDMHDTSEHRNGNQYILDLSFDELKELGFDIKHHIVFYRNKHQGANCIFTSVRHAPLWYRDSTSKDYKSTKYYDITTSLQRDTFPDITEFFTRELKGRELFQRNTDDAVWNQLNTISTGFFPVYTSDLYGKISGLNSIDSFESSNDTLVPVVVRFSRLRCDLKQDHLFWFTPTEDFFRALPERYQFIKENYEVIKIKKRDNSENNLVEYSIEDWVSKQMLPTGTKIDGSGNIIQLTDAELENIGLFKNLENNTTCNYRTPWGGTGLGGKLEYVPGEPISADSIPVMKHDTVFYSDFSFAYGTDLHGNSLSISTTGRLIGKFLLDNDVLLPIEYDDKLLWFTLSDSLWKLLPERYQYLKNEYNKYLFNKSLLPDQDLVIYFKSGLDKIDMDVTILDLDKNELKDLGFQFDVDKVSIDLVYGDEWMQYIIRDGYYNLPERAKKRKSLKPELFLQNHVFDLAIDTRYSSTTGDQRNQYDSLITTNNKGYHVLMITDTLGHNLHRIETHTKYKFIEQDELKHLIPVRVSLNKYFRDYSEEKIFWFTPTEDFFNRLPARYKADIITEYNGIHENKESGGCTYFEECRSTLELTDFHIFPNPAKNHITISIENLELTSGKISLISINGSIVKELIPDTDFFIGNSTYEIELGDVNPGIYLVAIQTVDGIKAKRLIVNE